LGTRPTPPSGGKNPICYLPKFLLCRRVMSSVFLHALACEEWRYHRCVVRMPAKQTDADHAFPTSRSSSYFRQVDSWSLIAKQSRYTPWWRLRGEDYSCYSFLTSALDGVNGQHRPRFTPGGKDPRYPLYRRLGGPQSRSGHRG
jgi:hypothetical protein